MQTVPTESHVQALEAQRLTGRAIDGLALAFEALASALTSEALADYDREDLRVAAKSLSLALMGGARQTLELMQRHER